MTEHEAREILHAYFKKWLRPNHVIFIGKVYSCKPTGYSFEAGTYPENEPCPIRFPIWGVDAYTKSVGLDLVKRMDNLDLNENFEWDEVVEYDRR